MTTRETTKATPRYRAVAAELTEEIRRGVYPPGGLLPTEVELGLRFAAGRHTVRDALRIISEQGLIMRRAGLGSVVMASDPPGHFNHSVTSLAEWLRYPTETWRETCRSGGITADRALAALLKCERGKRWFRISSVRRGAGMATPLAWTEIYVLPHYAAVEKRQDHGRTPCIPRSRRCSGKQSSGLNSISSPAGSPRSMPIALRRKPVRPR